MRLSVGMKGRQLVERHLRPDVVFDVIRHVPCNKTQDSVGKGRSRVFKHVGDLGAVAVFSQKVKPQGGLANQCRQDPDPKQDGR